MKLFFRNIILSLLRRLSPAIEEVLVERQQEHLQYIVSELKSCGSNFHIGANARIDGGWRVRIGDNFSAGDHLRIEAITRYQEQVYSPILTIGNDVRVEDNCHIGCVERVEIGDGTLLASKVFISDHAHGNVDAKDIDVAPLKRPLVSQPIKIGRNVWIGENVCILPGVELGDNVIVGANAVVTHSFPKNSVIAGCPAKLLRTLGDK